MSDQDVTDINEAVRRVRAHARRRQLLDAAAAVMERTGFHQMSMQALAEEASVSVGLAYKYFRNKEELLLATIVDILEAFEGELTPAMDAVGSDPAERLAAGFRRYTEVVEEHRYAVILTYRESRTLDAEGREKIKQLEIATALPLRLAIEDGVAAGIFDAPDADLVTYNLMMQAHSWALKHWHFAALGLDGYIRAQTRYFLRALLTNTADYPHLTGDPPP